MKKVFVIFLLNSLMFFGTSLACASTSYLYKFEGSIWQISDGTGILSEAGLDIDSEVNYSILVNLNQDGSYTRIDETTIDYSDFNVPNVSQDYFYADFVAGSSIPLTDAGYYNSPTNIAEFNYGLNQTTYGGVPPGQLGDYGKLEVLSQSSSISIYDYDLKVSDWTIGEELQTTANAYPSTGHHVRYEALVTLTDIIPAPAELNCPNKVTLWIPSISDQSYWNSIGEAYNYLSSLGEYGVMYITGENFYGDDNFYSEVQVTLEGGYTCDYATNLDYTSTIYGALIISTGTVIVDNLTIR